MESQKESEGAWCDYKGYEGDLGWVVQEEQKSWKKQLEVRGTTKAAILKGDQMCPDLIVTIVYDTKPVHHLSMSSEELKWVVCENDM